MEIRIEKMLYNWQYKGEVEMYDESQIIALKSEYNELTLKERDLERRINEIKLRKTEIQREIAKNQPTNYEEMVLTQLYEQKQNMKKGK